MERAARRFLLLVLGVTAVSHGSHFSRYFIRDEIVGLHRVSAWTFGDIVGRSRLFFTGELGARPHVLAYGFIKSLWALFGPFYPGYAGTMLALHLAVTALVVSLAARLAPDSPSLAPLAGLLFGMNGASAELGNFTIVQHVVLALAAVALALAYLAYRRRPSGGRAAAVLAWATLAAFTQESGPIATLTPLVLEACLRLGPAPANSEIRAQTRSTVWLALASFGVSLPRLAHEATALLVRTEALDVDATERYSVSFGPAQVLSNLAHLLSEFAHSPPVVAAPLAVLLLAGASSRKVRVVAWFGAAEGFLLALPYTTIRYTAPFYAYSAAPFWSLALAAAAVAVGEKLLSAVEPRRRGRAVTGVVALALLGATARFRAHDAADARAFSALRGIRAGLEASLPPGGSPVNLVLYGVPTGRVHPDYPLMLAEFLPVFVPGRDFREVWVIDPRVAEPLSVDFVTYSARGPDAPARDELRFTLKDDRLLSCTGPRCAGD